MGLYVLYFGTKRQYRDVQHHTVIFGQRYRALLSEIFNTSEISDDLSLYLHRPTATDPSLAPPGHDAFYVLAPVPNLALMDNWQIEQARVRARVLEILEDRILPDLGENIDICFDFTPNDFREQYRSADGAGFSVAPLLTQSAYFRFHNRSQDIDKERFSHHTGAGIFTRRDHGQHN